MMKYRRSVLDDFFETIEMYSKGARGLLHIPLDRPDLVLFDDELYKLIFQGNNN